MSINLNCKTCMSLDQPVTQSEKQAVEADYESLKKETAGSDKNNFSRKDIRFASDFSKNQGLMRTRKNATMIKSGKHSRLGNGQQRNKRLKTAVRVNISKRCEIVILFSKRRWNFVPKRKQHRQRLMISF